MRARQDRRFESGSSSDDESSDNSGSDSESSVSGSYEDSRAHDFSDSEPEDRPTSRGPQPRLERTSIVQGAFIPPPPPPPQFLQSVTRAIVWDPNLPLPPPPPTHQDLINNPSLLYKPDPPSQSNTIDVGKTWLPPPPPPSAWTARQTPSLTGPSAIQAQSTPTYSISMPSQVVPSKPQPQQTSPNLSSNMVQVYPQPSQPPTPSFSAPSSFAGVPNVSSAPTVMPVAASTSSMPPSWPPAYSSPQITMPTTQVEPQPLAQIPPSMPSTSSTTTESAPSWAATPVPQMQPQVEQQPHQLPQEISSMQSVVPPPSSTAMASAPSYVSAQRPRIQQASYPSPQQQPISPPAWVAPAPGVSSQQEGSAPSSTIQDQQPYAQPDQSNQQQVSPPPLAPPTSRYDPQTFFPPPPPMPQYQYQQVQAPVQSYPSQAVQDSSAFSNANGPSAEPPSNFPTAPQQPSNAHGNQAGADVSQDAQGQYSSNTQQPQQFSNPSTAWSPPSQQVSGEPPSSPDQASYSTSGPLPSPRQNRQQQSQSDQSDADPSSDQSSPPNRSRPQIGQRRRVQQSSDGSEAQDAAPIQTYSARRSNRFSRQPAQRSQRADFEQQSDGSSSDQGSAPVRPYTSPWFQRSGRRQRGQKQDADSQQDSDASSSPQYQQAPAFSRPAARLRDAQGIGRVSQSDDVDQSSGDGYGQQQSQSRARSQQSDGYGNSDSDQQSDYAQSTNQARPATSSNRNGQYGFASAQGRKSQTQAGQSDSDVSNPPSPSMSQRQTSQSSSQAGWNQHRGRGTQSGQDLQSDSEASNPPSPRPQPGGTSGSSQGPGFAAGYGQANVPGQDSDPDSSYQDSSARGKTANPDANSSAQTSSAFTPASRGRSSADNSFGTPAPNAGSGSRGQTNPDQQLGSDDEENGVSNQASKGASGPGAAVAGGAAAGAGLGATSSSSFGQPDANDDDQDQPMSKAQSNFGDPTFQPQSRNSAAAPGADDLDTNDQSLPNSANHDTGSAVPSSTIGTGNSQNLPSGQTNATGTPNAASGNMSDDDMYGSNQNASGPAAAAASGSNIAFGFASGATSKGAPAQDQANLSDSEMDQGNSGNGLGGQSKPSGSMGTDNDAFDDGTAGAGGSNAQSQSRNSNNAQQPYGDNGSDDGFGANQNNFGSNQGGGAGANGGQWNDGTNDQFDQGYGNQGGGWNGQNSNVNDGSYGAQGANGYQDPNAYQGGYGGQDPNYNQGSQDPYANQGWGNQGYGDQGYGNQGYDQNGYQGYDPNGNQGWGNQGYGNDPSWGNQAYDQGYGGYDQGYRDDNRYAWAQQGTQDPSELEDRFERERARDSRVEQALERAIDQFRRASQAASELWQRETVPIDNELSTFSYQPRRWRDQRAQEQFLRLRSEQFELLQRYRYGTPDYENMTSSQPNDPFGWCAHLSQQLETTISGLEKHLRTGRESRRSRNFTHTFFRALEDLLKLRNSQDEAGQMPAPTPRVLDDPKTFSRVNVEELNRILEETGQTFRPAWDPHDVHPPASNQHLQQDLDEAYAAHNEADFDRQVQAQPLHVPETQWDDHEREFENSSHAVTSEDLAAAVKEHSNNLIRLRQAEDTHNDSPSRRSSAALKSAQSAANDSARSLEQQMDAVVQQHQEASGQAEQADDALNNLASSKKVLKRSLTSNALSHKERRNANAQLEDLNREVKLAAQEAKLAHARKDEAEKTAHLSAAHDQEVNRRAVESAQRKVSEAKAQHRNKPNDKALAELRQAKAELAQAEKKLNDAKREEDKHARAGQHATALEAARIKVDYAEKDLARKKVALAKADGQATGPDWTKVMNRAERDVERAQAKKDKVQQQYDHLVKVQEHVEARQRLRQSQAKLDQLQDEKSAERASIRAEAEMELEQHRAEAARSARQLEEAASHTNIRHQKNANHILLVDAQDEAHSAERELKQTQRKRDKGQATQAAVDVATSRHETAQKDLRRHQKRAEHLGTAHKLNETRDERRQLQHQVEKLENKVAHAHSRDRADLEGELQDARTRLATLDQRHEAESKMEAKLFAQTDKRHQKAFGSWAQRNAKKHHERHEGQLKNAEIKGIARRADGQSDKREQIAQRHAQQRVEESRERIKNEEARAETAMDDDFVRDTMPRRSATTAASSRQQSPARRHSVASTGSRHSPKPPSKMPANVVRRDSALSMSSQALEGAMDHQQRRASHSLSKRQRDSNRGSK